MNVSGSGGRVPGHTWLSYDGRDGFPDAGRSYLSGGAADNARLIYASGRPVEQMQQDVGLFDPDGALRASGTLTLLPYDEQADLRAEDYVDYFAAETERALQGGHTGLRVLAELSGLAEGPQRGKLIRYEHLADRYMASHPMSSLCVVDRARVSQRAVAELEAVHPQVASDSRSVGFRLLPEDDGLRLTGVVDAWDAEPLTEVLEAIAGSSTTLRLHVDELDFIGARGLAALARHRRRLADRGVEVLVVGTSPVVDRACAVLDLDVGRAT